MRMTKHKKELVRLYRREREQGFQARWALANARNRLEWDKHEVAEYSNGEPIDPKRGNVRLRIVPDDSCSLEDLEGDCFNPEANPDIPASRLQRDRKEFIAKVNREGAWGIVGEFFDGEHWQHADSCFGFVGEDWKTAAMTRTSCGQRSMQQVTSVVAPHVAGRLSRRRTCADGERTTIEIDSHEKGGEVVTPESRRSCSPRS